MVNRKKVLFICTGNSCRSQMAEGLLRDMAGDQFEVFSAGSHPSRLHPASTIVMAELGINVSEQIAESINKYLNINIDIVISVCDNALENCPVFPENVEKIHWSIDDPFHGWGTEAGDLIPYRKTRDILNNQIRSFVNKENNY